MALFGRLSMAMTIETMLLLAFLSLVVMLLRNEDTRPAVARIASTSRDVQYGRHVA
jgi:hypothetical protein